MRTLLYLGLEEPSAPYSKFYYDKKNTTLIHYPIIKIIPCHSLENVEIFNRFLSFTHLIFTSKTSVKLFFDSLANFPFSRSQIEEKNYIVIGQTTAYALKKAGIDNLLIAKEETAEGVIELLKTYPLKNSHILFPHSKLSRNTLTHFFLENNLKFDELILYEPVPNHEIPFPDLSAIDEIIFTSPSTVDAFLTFSKLPKDKILTPIGPITKQYLEKKFCINSTTCVC